MNAAQSERSPTTEAARRAPSLREILFWAHLVAGASAGLVIALLCATGAAIAFQPQILELVTADARAVTVGAERLPLRTLVERAAATRPEKAPTAVTVHAEPDAAVLVAWGREHAVWVDPYTGDVREQGGQAWRDFFAATTGLHRWLGAVDEGRDPARAVTGAANAVFLFLAVSGLVLWLPRRRSLAALRAGIWFRGGLRGRARDWSWHNVIGFWSLPVLVVLTASGMVISYHWASDLVYTLNGEPPVRGRPPPAEVEVVDPGPTAAFVEVDRVVAAAAADVPGWERATLTLTASPPRDRALALSVRAADRWPRTASEQVWVDPYTAEVVRHDGFTDATPGRQARTWLRYLHTGEALGWPGQLAAGLASLGGVVLVWTGLALALRRFAAWRRR